MARPLGWGLVTAGAGAAVALTAGRSLDRIGTVGDEARRPLPGDELVGREALVRTRATAVDAPASAVWPWLVQLGWGRAGWYSIDAVERLVGAARSVDDDGATSWRSLTHIAERHQDLAVGDTVPLQDGIGFEVVALDAPRHLVLRIDAAGVAMVWALVLLDEGDRCRLLARTSVDARGALRTTAVRTILDPGHAVMELVQLRGIARRAERHHREAPT